MSKDACIGRLMDEKDDYKTKYYKCRYALIKINQMDINSDDAAFDMAELANKTLTDLPDNFLGKPKEQS